MKIYSLVKSENLLETEIKYNWDDVSSMLSKSNSIKKKLNEQMKP